jgi:putative glutamine amidotransferase
MRLLWALDIIKRMIHLKIAITDTFNPKLDYYFSWLNRFETNLEWVVISHKSNNLQELDTADGLLFTGGGDLDPALLGITDSAGLSKDIDRASDDFELQAVHLALAKGLPLLGICRGLQVVNFACGGTLILDLPSAGFKDHSNTNNYQLAHPVTVKPNTLLARLTGKSLLQINTSHHQAIDKPGKGLIASACSPDGVIEAAEWETKEGKPFCCLVQWHPERMTDAPDNTASRALAEGFLRATREKALSRD